MKRLSKHSLSISAGDVAGWIGVVLLCLGLWAIAATAVYMALQGLFWFFLDKA